MRTRTTAEAAEVVPFAEPKALTASEAKSWAQAMKNTDGTTGAHWGRDQAEAVLKQRGLPYDTDVFWAVLNSAYSDYAEVAKRYGQGGNVDFYVDLAKAWLDDKDAIGGGGSAKAGAYWQYVVTHDQ